MTKTIPYNTYGTVTTRASVTIPASNVPYTYEPLKSDLYIASDLTNVAPKPVITNMYEYAQRNIPNYQNITEIPSGHLPTDINTSLANNWCIAFRNCSNLKSLPDPFYNTNNATNMYGMFLFCTNLTTMPNFDTGNVTNMYWMFASCRNLNTVPNFDTSNVTDMYRMFTGCINLTTVPNFNTSKVINMSNMFYQCYNLTTVPNFDTSNVTDMGDMFYSDSELTTISNFNTSNVTNMHYTFYNCDNLTTIPNFDTSKVTNMYSMFTFCANLTTIPIFNFNSVTNMNNMFKWCRNIRGNLYMESNNISNTFNLFANCTAYIKNIYCHANTTTYNSIYNAMGNNTYNSNWNAYLKTFGSEPIPLLKIADAFDENGKQDTVNYVFRTPLSNINLYVDSNNGYQTYISDIANVTPYQDLNISVQFSIPSSISSMSGYDPDPGDPDPLPPLGLKIINRDTNEEIYNSFNGHTIVAAFNVNYYLGI